MKTAENQTPPADSAADPTTEPPPILGSWRRLYTVLILSQVGVALALWLLSRAYG
jgi:hypothetical protein